MQTFLPHPNFTRSLLVLDYRRLGKQRVEAKQILDTLWPNSTSRWRNHPAVRMWSGYEEALKMYHNEAIIVWEDRGYKNNMKLLTVNFENLIIPKWLGNEKFHASHRSNLLRKHFEHYSRYNWTETNDMPYFWPTKEGY